MIEAREDLPLRAEALQHVGRMESAGHELDCDFFFIFGVDAPRPVDLAHAPVADERGDFVRADAPAEPMVLRGTEEVARDVSGGRPVDNGVARGVRGQQRLDFRAKPGVSGAGLVEAGFDTARIQLAGRGEDLLHAPPALRRHGVPPAVSSRCRNARAIAHSRLAVAGDTSITAAASWMLSPPKKRSSTSRPCSGSSASRRSSAW